MLKAHVPSNSPGYKEPFEQMDGNSCKLGVVPNVHSADVCTRVPQSESDPTLGRSHIPSFNPELHSYRETSVASVFLLLYSHFNSFYRNCLFCLTNRIAKLHLVNLNSFAATVRLCRFRWKFLLKHRDNSKQQPQPQNHPAPA